MMLCDDLELYFNIPPNLKTNWRTRQTGLKNFAFKFLQKFLGALMGSLVEFGFEYRTYLLAEQ